MKKVRPQILKVSYEFIPLDSTKAVKASRELDGIFDALFDMTLKVGFNTLDQHEIRKGK